MKPVWIAIIGAAGACTSAHASSWGVPLDFSTIGDAIDRAVDGDTIRVAAGTWYERLDFGGKNLVVEGAPQGFGGGPYRTVIEGQGQGSVVSFVNGESRGATLRHLIIQGGAGTIHPEREMLAGGGIYIWGASPTIDSCEVRFNVTLGGYGAGIFCSNGAPRIVDCVIQSNDSANGFGGGLHCQAASAEISRCSVIGNRSYDGGGIYCGGRCQPLISDCEIRGNRCPNGWGGGMHCSRDSEPVVDGCVIAENSALLAGGGIGVRYSAPSILNCVIERNAVTRLDGGGVALRWAEGEICNTVIRQNVAERAGGGVAIQHSSTTRFRNVLFSGNHAEEQGGAVHVYQANPVLDFCTIAGNRALGEGGGVYAMGATQMEIRNSILWEDIGGEIAGDGQGPVVQWTNVPGGWPGEGNLDADPRFAVYKELKYVLRGGSPCIDAGDSELSDTIYDANPAWPDDVANGSRADMGAYGGPANRYWFTN